MEFVSWGKTSRLFRNVTITEKIDGSNSAIIVEKNPVEFPLDGSVLANVSIDGEFYHVGAQSRKRLLTLERDNHGFAHWVQGNSRLLVTVLGTGRHFGEWAGKGINRGYNADGKTFFLFNTKKWANEIDIQVALIPGLSVVPVLYEGVFAEWAIDDAIDQLDKTGSVAYPGFDRPEGICIYHSQNNSIFKYTPNEKDDGNKG